MSETGGPGDARSGEHPWLEEVEAHFTTSRRRFLEEEVVETGGQEYPWTRALVLSGRAESEYLTPEGMTRDDAEGLVAFEDASMSPTGGACIVIAEGGGGKTFALWADADRKHSSGIPVGVFALGDVQSEREVVRLFRDEALRTLLASRGDRVLYFDGFEESGYVQQDFAGSLSDELGKLTSEQRERLHIVITTRMSQHVDRLQRSLAQRLSTAPVYSLAPLRLRDIATATAEDAFTDAQFVTAVRRQRAMALAARPFTLRMLLDEFRERGALVSSPHELFRRATLALCYEVRNRSVFSAPTHRLSPAERLAICRRIAAVMTFANLQVVEGETTHAREGVLALPEVLSGVELVDDMALAVDLPNAHEALATGLFRMAGPFRLAWLHQHYRDFLAAEWILLQGFDAATVLPLLTDNGRLIPDLVSVAGWLAGLIPGVLERLIELDPEQVAQGATWGLVSPDPSSVVDALLKPDIAARILNSRPNPLLSDPTVLPNFPELAGKVRQAIQPHNPEDVRVMAAYLARRAVDSPVVTELATIAADIAAPPRLRRAAAVAVRDAGTDAARRRLRTILDHAINDEDLVGVVFQALRERRLVTASEILDRLPTEDDGVFTTLDYFLGRQLAPTLSADEVPVALEWAERQPDSHHLHMSRRDLIAGVVQTSSAFLGVPDVSTRLYKFLRARWQHHDDLGASLPEVAAALRENDAVRRQWIDWIGSDPEPFIAALGFLRVGGTISIRDAGYLVERAAEANEASAPAYGIMLAQSLHDDPTQHTAVDAAFSLWEQDPSRFPSLASAFGSQSLSDRPRTKPKKSELERIAEAMDAIRSASRASPRDAVAAWRACSWAFTWFAGERIPGGPIVGTALWEALTPSDRGDLTEIAQAFLAAAPIDAQWMQTNAVPDLALYGYSALGMLYEAGTLDAVVDNGLAKWYSTVLAVPASEIQEAARASRLVEYLAQRGGAAFVDAVRAVAASDIANHDHVFVLHKLDRVQGDSISQVLVELAEQSSSPNAVRELLSAAIERGSDEARSLAVKLLATWRSDDPVQRGIAIAAARALFHAPDAGWPYVWPLMQDFPETGRAVVETEERESGLLIGVGIADRLTDEQLARLFEWFRAQYPESERKPLKAGAGFSVFEPQFVESQLLEALANRGTRSACSALRELKNAHPEWPWLTRVLDRAEEVRRTFRWTGVAPSDLLSMARRRTRRVIKSGDDLLELVSESLARLGERLHGPSPIARFLWNETTGHRGHAPVRVPKTELNIADFVKTWLDLDLRERGVILNREVEITRVDRTDIHVNAVAKEGTAVDYKVLEATIEVKGDWHRDVLTAMETQLAERYLRHQTCRHGLYLVMWFRCPEWSVSDNRYKQRRRPSATRSDFERRLTQQAEGLSAADRKVKAMVLDASWC